MNNFSPSQFTLIWDSGNASPSRCALFTLLQTGSQMKVSFFHCSIIFFLEFCIADGHPLNPRRGQKYWRNHRWAFDRNSFAVNSNRDFVLFVSLNLSCKNFFFSQELFTNRRYIIMAFGSSNSCCRPLTIHWTVLVLSSEDFTIFGEWSNFRHQLDCHVESLLI